MSSQVGKDMLSVASSKPYLTTECVWMLPVAWMLSVTAEQSWSRLLKLRRVVPVITRVRTGGRRRMPRSCYRASDSSESRRSPTRFSDSVTLPGQHPRRLPRPELTAKRGPESSTV